MKCRVPIVNLTPIPLGNLCCAEPIGVDESVNVAVVLIQECIELETSTTYRKTPLIVSRCARGGKTTILSKLHSALQAAGVMCLSVSFNGVSGFRRSLSTETETEALFRMITNQLDPSMETQSKRYVDWKLVDNYIGEGPFVLLIDEINALTTTIGSDLAEILKEYFLDKKNRFLVMSSHQPFMTNVDGNSISPLWSDSVSLLSCRSIQLLKMPESYNIEQLIKMNETKCSGLTRSQASFYGGIPSLMYIVSIQKTELPATRFSLYNQRLPLPTQDLFVDFVEAVVTGMPNISLKRYFCFSSDVSAEDNTGVKITWPLCYIQCVMEQFSYLDVAMEIKECIETLAKDSKTVGDGMVWEQSVRIAVLLQFVLAVNGKYKLPFDLGDVIEARNADIKVIPLGQGIKSVEEARLKINSYSNHFSRNTLVLFTPIEASLAQFDGFCVRFENHQLQKVCGYQCKDNRKGAKGQVPDWITGGGHLLRNEAPTRCKKEGYNEKRWLYYNSTETDQFLGWSLRMMRK